jgi:cytochrome c peroxidase
MSRRLLRILYVQIGLIFVSACSETDSVRTDGSEDLVQKIWQKLSDAETGAYREPLSAEDLAQHEAAIALIKTSIPLTYPEPYLPMGRLKNRALDPGLVRQPALTVERIELGKALFAETSLSYSRTHGFSQAFGLSCQGCHQVGRDFTDGQVLSAGIEGDLTLRNTPTLWNAAYYSTLTWSNPHFPILELQAKIPLFNDDPIEMGLRGKEQEMMAHLAESDRYQALFQSAFKIDLRQSLTAGPVEYTLVTEALAAFERTLIRLDSTFDLYLQGKGRVDDDVKLGASLFYGINSLNSGEVLNCAQCHSGILMTDSFQYVRQGFYYNKSVFHGEIRTPSLRFVGKTAPYFHDGSLASLDDVLELYARTGRAGTGAAQPPFTLTSHEREAVLRFLRSL